MAAACALGEGAFLPAIAVAIGAAIVRACEQVNSPVNRHIINPLEVTDEQVGADPCSIARCGIGTCCRYIFRTASITRCRTASTCSPVQQAAHSTAASQPASHLCLLLLLLLL